MTTPLALAADFPAPDPAQWRVRAEKALGKATWDSLAAHLPGGVDIQPLYTAADTPPQRLIGRAGPWDIRQIVETVDPVAANADMLAELNGGATSIELRIALPGGRGARIDGGEALARALDGMMLDMAPLAFDSGADTGPAQLLAEYAARRGVNNTALAFNIDPLAPLRFRAAPGFESAIAFAKEAAKGFPAATALRVDARPAHEAGGGEVQELAFMLAAGLSLLRAGEKAGLSPSQTAQQILFTLALGPDVIVEIAKLRAARIVWARVMQACDAANAPMRLQAVTGRRMMTRADVWTNILRVTAAAFAGGVGGADCVTTLPFSEAIGQPNPLARRIARNTQLLLQEEAHVAMVRDPGAGCFAIETLTDDLAHAAWALFQDIERRGGIVAAMDWLSSEIENVAAQRQADAKDKKNPILGVSVYPPADEKPFAAEPWPQTPAPPLMAPMRLAAAFESL